MMEIMKKTVRISLIFLFLFSVIAVFAEEGHTQPTGNTTETTSEASSETGAVNNDATQQTTTFTSEMSTSESGLQTGTSASEMDATTSIIGEEENLPAHLMLLRYGIIKGDANGDLLLDKDINRAEMTIVFIRMLGVEEEAKAHSPETGFADQMAIPKWARSYIAYARSVGLMRGDEFGVFNPRGKINGEQLAAMLRRILGYREQVKWKENIAALEQEAGIQIPDKPALLRSEVFEVLWKAFSENVKSGGGSLMEKFSHIGG